MKRGILLEKKGRLVKMCTLSVFYTTKMQYFTHKVGHGPEKAEERLSSNRDRGYLRVVCKQLEKAVSLTC